MIKEWSINIVDGFLTKLIVKLIYKEVSINLRKGI
jgi:hypothetical protein